MNYYDFSALDRGRPQYVNRGFVPLAIEAGIVEVIASLVGLAMDDIDLCFQLKLALRDANPELARAINLDSLRALMDYIAATVEAAPVVRAEALPKTVNEDGPETVVAARDKRALEQVNISFVAPPAGYTYEIYLNGVFLKRGENPASEGWVSDFITGVPEGKHAVRILYVTPEEKLTRFGSLAEVD